ncbi:hypothetical protein MCHI_002498, partial [Candidatus Magnetoovum chiemensis]
MPIERDDKLSAFNIDTPLVSIKPAVVINRDIYKELNSGILNSNEPINTLYLTIIFCITYNPAKTAAAISHQYFCSALLIVISKTVAKGRAFCESAKTFD